MANKREKLTRLLVCPTNGAGSVAIYLWLRSKEIDIAGVILGWPRARVLSYDQTARAWALDIAKDSNRDLADRFEQAVRPWATGNLARGTYGIDDYCNRLLSLAGKDLPDGYRDVAQAAQAFIDQAQSEIHPGSATDNVGILKSEDTQAAIRIIESAFISGKRQSEIKSYIEVRKLYAKIAEKKDPLTIEKMQSWDASEEQQVLDQALIEKHREALGATSAQGAACSEKSNHPLLRPLDMRAKLRRLHAEPVEESLERKLTVARQFALCGVQLQSGHIVNKE